MLTDFRNFTCAANKWSLQEVPAMATEDGSPGSEWAHDGVHRLGTGLELQ